MEEGLDRKGKGRKDKSEEEKNKQKEEWKKKINLRRRVKEKINRKGENRVESGF